MVHSAAYLDHALCVCLDLHKVVLHNYFLICVWRWRRIRGGGCKILLHPPPLPGTVYPITAILCLIRASILHIVQRSRIMLNFQFTCCIHRMTFKWYSEWRGQILRLEFECKNYVVMGLWLDSDTSYKGENL